MARKKVIAAACVVLALIIGGIGFNYFNKSKLGQANPKSKQSSISNKNKKGDAAKQGKSDKSTVQENSSAGSSSSSAGQSVASSGSGTDSNNNQNATIVHARPANFGSLVKIQLSQQYKSGSISYFQVFDKSKPVSDVSNINTETTMYPSKPAGQNVTVKLFDGNKKLVAQPTAVIKSDK